MKERVTATCSWRPRFDYLNELYIVHHYYRQVFVGQMVRFISEVADCGAFVAKIALR